ncbi:ABC transporter permease [Streptomyces sp. NPDC053079]|uniref:ABC transporter permease n=1 Tax=Streptomyces sp. NPDC053079 TaxID=3365697 RepID=UPI0037D6CFEA
MTVLRGWARDLAMGVRFAVTGGRAGLLRTALTAAGVGIGVALLLFAAALPQALDARNTRAEARGDDGRTADRAGAATLLVQEADTVYRGRSIRGRLLRPEGPRAPKPPGVTALPAPGEMAVSPALRDLLTSERGALLRERLPHRIAGTVGDQGLKGPDELLYYAGDDHLAVRGHLPTEPSRITAFGDGFGEPQPGPAETLLGGMACAALLLPVCVLIATAVRFGGERRDRRLAALRLVGADNRTTRRVAAGETVCASLLGLALGGALFAGARQFAPRLSLRGTGFFPADFTPGPLSLALIVLGVPLAAVVIALFALRAVAIEPLGVVRGQARPRRRMWWRIAVPVTGLVVLAPYALRLRIAAEEGMLDYRGLGAVVGSTLVLLGVVTLLPWLVEAVVRRLRGGPPSWQLAIRRLQLDSGPASRAVTGITVAVAGAIAVQTLLAGVGAPASSWAEERDVVGVSMRLGPGDDARALAERFRGTRGVRSVAGLTHVPVARAGDRGIVTLAVGDCASLRRAAGLESCADGDVFVVDRGTPHNPVPVRPGTDLSLRRDAGDVPRWTVPATAPVVTRQDTSDFRPVDAAVLATPSAVDVRGLPDAGADLLVQLLPPFPDALEHVRNTSAAIGPGHEIRYLPDQDGASEYGTMLGILPWAAAMTLGLVATSLLLTTVEQLRERRRPLATLAAFGAPRSTVAWSVVWQTAVPVALGMPLAVLGGLALGRSMLSPFDVPVPDRFAFLPVVGLGLGVIALVTLAALPPLWRMMRPDGLRAE